MTKSDRSVMTVFLDWKGRNEALAEAQSLASDLLLEPLQNQGPCHRLVVGDNLQALQLLRNAHEQFDFIYIDPPYNSGQIFSYSDKHGRSSDNDDEDRWLSMMAPRLVCARDLLSTEGVIFVSIDDREMPALTLLLREIFGKKNHLGTFKWRRKRKPSFLDKHMSTMIEYVLAFAKDAAHFPRLVGEKAEYATRPVLNASNPIAERVLPRGFPAHCGDGIHIRGQRMNRTLEVEFLDDLCVELERLTHPARVRGRFRVSQAILERSGFITKNFGMRRHVLPEEIKRRHASDDCTTWPTNEDAEQELRTHFGQRVFDYPKPVGLLEGLLSMCQFPARDPVRCLDFFAGSGTLAEAAVRLSRTDGIPRVFTLVQSPEPTQGPAATSFATIADIAEARARRTVEEFQPTFPLEILKIIQK